MSCSTWAPLIALVLIALLCIRQQSVTRQPQQHAPVRIYERHRHVFPLLTNHTQHVVTLLSTEAPPPPPPLPRSSAQAPLWRSAGARSAAPVPPSAADAAQVWAGEAKWVAEVGRRAHQSSPFCSDKTGLGLLARLRVTDVCSHAQELSVQSQQRKFPFRAVVLRDGVIGPGPHRPHGSSQPGLSLQARCASPPRFAPLPPSYASMVSRLVRHVSVAQPGEAPPAKRCEEAALVVIEPPDLWNVWWLLTEALTEYALLTALLPAVLPRGLPLRVARVVDDRRAHAAGHAFFRALLASDGTDLN